jgi:hypothetical protein
MNNALTENMKADLMHVAENEPVRLSTLDDNGLAMIEAGLLDAEPGDVFGVLTLDGCDAVDAIRRERGL